MAYSQAIIVIATLSFFSLYKLVKSNTVCLAYLDSDASISYRTNLNLLFSEFNAQSSSKAYYNNSKGDTPDKVFGFYICRGDLKPEACRNCIRHATRTALETECKSKDALFFSSECNIYYANHSMFGMWENLARTSEPLRGVSNYQQHSQKLSPILEALIDEAAFGSHKNKSLPGFATKEGYIRRGEKIYSLAQCTPDILGVNCSRCLNEGLSIMLSSYKGYQGVAFYSPNCQLTYDNQLFYDAELVELNMVDGLRPSNLLFLYFVLFLFSYILTLW